MNLDLNAQQANTLLALLEVALNQIGLRGQSDEVRSLFDAIRAANPEVPAGAPE